MPDSALQNYFQQRGQIAQHNARILAAQRGLTPFPDEDPNVQPQGVNPAGILAALRAAAQVAPPQTRHTFDPAGWGSSGESDSGVGTAEKWTPAQMAVIGGPMAVAMTAQQRQAEAPLQGPPPPKAPPLPRNEPARALPLPPEADQFQPEAAAPMRDQPDVFWEEGGRGQPVTSFSKVFNQSATFAPGTTIYGRGTVDPLKEQEWRAMQAAIDDYSRKRMAVEAANAIPEGRMREMWADNPEAAAIAQARMQQGLAQGIQALGPQPSRALPSEVTRSDARAQAQGRMEAQPYTNAAELAALMGIAERVTSPAYAAAEMTKARVGAEAQLQQPVLDKGAIDTARLEAVNRARGNSMFGDLSMTPAQEGAMTDQAPGEPGTTERPPMGSARQRPGTGMQIPMANLQRWAAQRNLPLPVARQKVEALGYTVTP